MTTILVAAEAKWVRDQVRSAFVSPGQEVVEVTRGQDVRAKVAELEPDLVVLDLQIGNMGGMAACMSIRLEEGIGNLPRLPVLMLLDRHDDVFLADRSDAEGWLIKPLDAFRLRRACAALLVGDQVREGVETPAEVTAPETA